MAKIVAREPKVEKADTQAEIVGVCQELADMLCEKNRKYGDSALKPKRIFSKADSVEQVKVRMDDKLSRIESGQADDDEDATWDFLGYGVLLVIAARRKKRAQ